MFSFVKLATYTHESEEGQLAEASLTQIVPLGHPKFLVVLVKVQTFNWWRFCIYLCYEPLLPQEDQPHSLLGYWSFLHS